MAAPTVVQTDNRADLASFNDETFTAPGGAQTGDMVIVQLATDNSSGMTGAMDTVPGIFTDLLGGVSYGNGSMRVFWAIHDGSASYQFTSTANSWTNSRAIWLRGVSSLGGTGSVGTRPGSQTTVTAPAHAVAGPVFVMAGERTLGFPDNVQSTSWGTEIAHGTGADSGGTSINSFSLIWADDNPQTDNTITYGASSGNAFAVVVEAVESGLPLYMGGQQASAVYAGSSPAVRIYRGSTQVWP